MNAKRGVLSGLAAWLPPEGEPPPQWYLDMAPGTHRASALALRLIEPEVTRRKRAKLVDFLWWRTFRVRRGQA